MSPSTTLSNFCKRLWIVQIVADYQSNP